MDKGNFNRNQGPLEKSHNFTKIRIQGILREQLKNEQPQSSSATFSEKQESVREETLSDGERSVPEESLEDRKLRWMKTMHDVANWKTRQKALQKLNEHETREDHILQVLQAKLYQHANSSI